MSLGGENAPPRPPLKETLPMLLLALGLADQENIDIQTRLIQSDSTSSYICWARGRNGKIALCVQTKLLDSGHGPTTTARPAEKTLLYTKIYVLSAIIHSTQATKSSYLIPYLLRFFSWKSTAWPLRE